MSAPAALPARAGADADFAARLAGVAAEIERTLDEMLGASALPGEIERPARLLSAMRYAALGGGKRLRAFLLVETAALFAAERTGALRAGAALELVHAYSLVHDDLPAMDDDDLRRGKPATHRAFDEATAILAGDCLLTLAFDAMADPATAPDPALRLALIGDLARAAGLGGMAGGQALDLAAETATAPLGEDAIARLQAMKTGALIACAVNAGARLGRAGAAEREALARYGRALGAAFQIADDILDAEGETAALGKAAGKDADRNKATLVARLGLEPARERRDLAAAAALEALASVRFPEGAAALAAAARFAASRRS